MAKEQCISDKKGRCLARYQPDWLSEAEQAKIWPLLQGLPWQRPEVTIFGKSHPIPRQQCYLGEPGCEYRYSGLLMSPEPVPPGIDNLMQRINRQAGASFNALLVNRYQDGSHRMGWHRDNEPELAPVSAPVLAILSLGASRRLGLRFDKGDSQILTLEPGSLLWLSPGVYHGINSAVRAAERISLTFRQIIPNFHRQG